MACHNMMKKNGFLFYPFQEIQSASIKFNKKQPTANNEIYLFADYMTKCWWYGFKVISPTEYAIGIIPNKKLSSFKFITNSLFEFLEMYLNDDEKLYNII